MAERRTHACATRCSLTWRPAPQVIALGAHRLMLNRCMFLATRRARRHQLPAACGVALTPASASIVVTPLPRCRTFRPHDAWQSSPTPSPHAPRLQQRTRDARPIRPSRRCEDTNTHQTRSCRHADSQHRRANRASGHRAATQSRQHQPSRPAPTQHIVWRRPHRPVRRARPPAANLPSNLPDQPLHASKCGCAHVT